MRLWKLILDIREKDNNYILDIDLPGVKKEDISIDLSDGYLTVSAETKNETDNSDETNGYIHKERYVGKCQRSYCIRSLIQ